MINNDIGAVKYVSVERMVEFGWKLYMLAVEPSKHIQESCETLHTQNLPTPVI